MKLKRALLPLVAGLAGGLLFSATANASAVANTASQSKTTVVYVNTLVGSQYKNIAIQVPTAWIKNLPAGQNFVNGKHIFVKNTSNEFVPTPEISTQPQTTIVYSNNKNLAISFEVQAQLAFYKTPNRNVQFQNDGTESYVGVTYLLNKKHDVQLFGNYAADIGVNGNYGFYGLGTDKVYAGVSTRSYGTLTFGDQDTAGDFASLLVNPSPDLGEINLLNTSSTATIVYQSPVMHGVSFIGSYNIGSGNADFSGTTQESTIQGGNSNGFATYLQDQLTLSKHVSVINQFAYNRLYKVSVPNTSNGVASDQQAWILGTNWYFGHGVGEINAGINYSKVIASNGNGVNVNYVGDRENGDGAIWSGIDTNSTQNKIGAFQTSLAIQYTKLGSQLYINYDNIQGGNLTGVGGQSSHGVILGATYSFSPSVFTFVEGSIFRGKVTGTTSSSTVNRALIVGGRWFF